jgi:AcrR family transcriptional regulator
VYESVQTVEQLPRGRHGLPREVVEEDQRRRLIAGVAEALAEHGYSRLTVAHVIERAAVSRRTFYEHFDGIRECLLAAYDDAERRLWADAAHAVAAADPDWAARVRGALAAALDFLAAEPATAHLFTLEARAADPALAERQSAAIDRLAVLLRAGREHNPAAASLPDSTEHTLLANVVALVSAQVVTGNAPRLPEAATQLSDYLLAPFAIADEAPVGS